MQTNPTQATLELLNNILGEWRSHGIIHACIMLEAAFAEREARLVGALGIVGKVLPSAAGLDCAPDSKIIACYMSIGEMRAIKSTLAALKDRTHG